jgi:hypothetical protein
LITTLSVFFCSPTSSRSKNKELTEEDEKIAKGCFHRMSFTVIRTRHERKEKEQKKRKIKGEEIFFPFLFVVAF